MAAPTTIPRLHGSPVPSQYLQSETPDFCLSPAGSSGNRLNGREAWLVRGLKPLGQKTGGQNPRVAPINPDTSSIQSSPGSGHSSQTDHRLTTLSCACPVLQTLGALQVPGPRPTFPPLPEQCPQPGLRFPRSGPSRSCSENAMVRTAYQVPVRMSGPHLLAGGPRASHVTSLSLSFLISAGERPAPRGPRTPSHGAGSREPGSAPLWPPRPRRSSSPPGPSAGARSPVRAEREGGASGCGWPRPREVPERRDALPQHPRAPRPIPNLIHFSLSKWTPGPRMGNPKRGDHWVRTLVINYLDSPS